MKNSDTRKLSPKEQYELRKYVLRLCRIGNSNEEISGIVGIHPTYVSIIWQMYLKGGVDALKPKVRGRRLGEQRKISVEQEAMITKLLVDKTPDQLTLPFALWSTVTVRSAIKQEFGIELPIRTVSEYLKRWGLSPQKLTMRTFEQNLKTTKQVFKSNHPEIVARAKRERAEIHWGDETGVQSSVYNISSDGKTQVVKTDTKHSGINMISTISSIGKIRFMLFHKTMYSPVFIKFLSRLIQDAKIKVFLILGNHRVHHSKMVKDWLKKHKDQIELFHLSPVPRNQPR